MSYSQALVVMVLVGSACDHSPSAPEQADHGDFQSLPDHQRVQFAFCEVARRTTDAPKGASGKSNGDEVVTVDAHSGIRYVARTDLVSMLEATPEKFRAPLPRGFEGYVPSDLVIYRDKVRLDHIALLIPRATKHKYRSFDFNVDQELAHVVVARVARGNSLALEYRIGNIVTGEWAVIRELAKRTGLTEYAHPVLLKSKAGFVVVCNIKGLPNSRGLEGLVLIELGGESSSWIMAKDVYEFRVVDCKEMGLLVLWNPDDAEYEKPGAFWTCRALLYRDGRWSNVVTLPESCSLTESVVSYSSESCRVTVRWEPDGHAKVLTFRIKVE